jgi:queuine tRNA-ribosyltransferase
VKEEGVIFNSHIDGKAVFLTPEKSIEIQHLLGSTITMCFDQCIKQPADYASTKAAMELSLRWALRSKDVYVSREGYGIFGIIQGGVFEDLRKYSTMAMLDIDFPGYAIGGLAVGETQETMFKILEYTTSLLPENKPRYLMGVGKPSDIIGAVHRGIDMFDCVLPTRSGRNGQAFVRGGVINIRNAKYINDLTSLDEQCNCYTCVNHTKAYLNHLIKSKEILGAMLMTIHNITHYNNMMAAIRYDIKNNMFHHSSATHKAFY